MNKYKIHPEYNFFTLSRGKAHEVKRFSLPRTVSLTRVFLVRGGVGRFNNDAVN